jgi:hypothetical protein
MGKKEHFKRASISNVEIDWIAIRNEYETTNISLAKLTKKYKKIKMNTIERRSAREGWKKSKKETQLKITENIREKTIESISENKSKVCVKHYDISDKFLKIIDDSFKNKNEFNTFADKVKVDRDEEEYKEFVLESINDKKLLNIVNSFEKIQKAQRQTLGIVDSDKLTRDDKLKVKEDEDVIVKIGFVDNGKDKNI